MKVAVRATGAESCLRGCGGCCMALHVGGAL